MAPTEAQVRVYEAYKESGCSVGATAKKLGITRNSVKKTLFNGHLNGLTVQTQYCKHLPAGMSLEKASVHVAKDGSVSGWYKGTALTPSDEEFAEFLKQRIPISTLDAPAPENCSEHYMLLWPVYDAHHGMLAWAKETGNDYDHKISRHLQVSAGKIISSSYGPVKRMVLVFGGDNQTADNRSGVTELHGNSLDTDTRFAKMVWANYETSVATIEIATMMAEEVFVIVLSGNHDYHSAVWLSVALHAHFRNHPRVTVDTSPEKHRFFLWGSTVFMASHGDVPDNRLATFALQQVLRRGLAKNCEIDRVRVLLGHIHKKSKKSPVGLTEEDGVIIEHFPTLAAQEAYAIEGAYTNCRATEVQLWHDKHGRHGGREVTVGEILERFPI